MPSARGTGTVTGHRTQLNSRARGGMTKRLGTCGSTQKFGGVGGAGGMPARRAAICHEEQWCEQQAWMDTYDPHELTPPRWAALRVGGIGGSISVQPSARSVATTASCVALSVFTLAYRGSLHTTSDGSGSAAAAPADIVPASRAAALAVFRALASQPRNRSRASASVASSVALCSADWWRPRPKSASCASRRRSSWPDASCHGPH